MRRRRASGWRTVRVSRGVVRVNPKTILCWKRRGCARLCWFSMWELVGRSTVVYHDDYWNRLVLLNGNKRKGKKRGCGGLDK